MHDWSLLSLTVDWTTGEVQLRVQSPSDQTNIHALDLRELRVPRAHPWGPSVSINAVNGPAPREDGLACLAIEMQSGDRIEIVARSFKMPDSARNAE